ncbi:MAG: SPOR domain-containing protein [Halanaerobiaceae bacterium]
MERSSGMSLTVLVIVLAMLGLLVGYLLGNWFIQLVTGESPDASQLADTGNKVVEEEIILEDNETEESLSGYYTHDSSTSERDDNEENNNNQIQSEDVFVVQVGAFNSKQNAKSLSNELIQKGYQTVITDEAIPYKVQLRAFANRNEAEEMKKEIESLGYDAFITH